MPRFLHPLGRLLLAALIFISAEASGQQTAKEGAAKSGELFDTIAGLDRKIFDAFNRHEVDPLMALFTSDLEFYHDTGGLTNFEQTRASFGQLFASAPDIRRELVKGSLLVYPIKGYGAVEIGEHTFCHKENGKDECGTFKFVMIWRKEGESWKISRVISVDH